MNTGNKKIVRSDINGENVHDVILSDDDNYILAYDLCTLDGSDEVILLTYSDMYYLTMYDETGSPSDLASISSAELTEYPFEVIRGNENTFFFLSSQYIFIFDVEKGIKKIKCPGDFFVSITNCSPEKTYVLYEDTRGTSFLSEIDAVSGKLNPVKEFPYRGLHICNNESNIILTDGNEIINFSLESGTFSRLCNLSDINLRSDWIKEIFSKDNTLFLICDTGKNKNSARVIALTPQTEGASESAVTDTASNTIKIYCPYGSEYVQSDLADYGYIDEFLLDYSDCSIEILTNNSVPEAEFIKDTCPDIIFFPFGIQETYIENGYLCDLTPYIEESGQINVGSFLPAMLEKYKKGGKIYALPQKFQVQTLVCKKSYFDKNSFGLGEFITWINDNTTLHLSTGLSKMSILRLCLDGMMSEYVDEEKKTASFDSDSFIELIAKMNSLKIEATSHEYISLFPTCFEHPEYFNGNFLYYTSINTPANIALMRRILNDELSFVGYPGMNPASSGVISDSNIMSVYINSNNKEVAYRFIEYCLCKETDSGPEVSTCSSVDYIRAKNTAASVGTVNLSYNGMELSYEVTDSDVDIFNKIIENASVQSSSYGSIKMVLLEEISSFFENNTSPQKVAEIIQSRASIILNE